MMLLVACIVAGGCLDSGEDDDDPTEDEQSSEDQDSGDDGPTGSDASSGSDSDSGSGSGSDMEDDPCRSHDGNPYPWDVCPSPECQYYETQHLVTSGCTGLMDRPSVCFAPTDQDIPFGQVLYDTQAGEAALLVPPCGTGDSVPAGFVSCSGSSEEPAQCACFCDDPQAKTGCPWNNEHQQMEDCDLPDPCETYDLIEGDPDDSAGRCILQALIDGGPARLQVDSDVGDGASHGLFYLLGEGAVLTIAADSIYSDGGCSNGPPDFGDLQRCTLIDDAYFEECLAVTDPNAWRECFDGYSYSGGGPSVGGDGLGHHWVENCMPAEPTCE